MSAAFPLPPDEATVAAYLGNQLPESQADAFEIYCLDHPDFARKVELDLCMKRGLREIGVRDLAPRPVLRFPPLWAMAAGLGTVVVCSLLLLAWTHRQVSLTAYRNLSEVPLESRTGVHFGVTLLRLRGPDPTHRVAVPRRSGVLRTEDLPRCLPGRQGYLAGILLDSIASSRSVQLQHLRADANGFVEVYMPLSAVVGHTLKITLAPDADTDAVPSPAFQLQVVAATD